MAALEYLTANSLTAHPFKSARAAVSGDNEIKPDWFYDILFTSFSSYIRSVFVSNITKNEYGDLAITFSNAETDEAVATLQLNSDDVVAHYKNILKSFASFSKETCAIKLVLGEGLVTAHAFSQDYTKEQAELSSTSIVLNSPRLSKLTFAAYDSHVAEEPFDLHSYSYPSVPTIKTAHNAEFIPAGSSYGFINIGRGLGSGLYDGCPSTDGILDLYSINGITPNDSGALFFNPSSCHSSATLSENSAVLLGAYSEGGYLYTYRTAQIHNENGTTGIFDAVDIDHSIVLQNFCKPKCPAENLNAFAYYLNRITDGVIELDKIVAGHTETRGRGQASGEDPTLFYASDFCAAGDDVFSRCSDPSLGAAYIACGGEFLKYFHEGRTLQLYYDSLTLRSYTIVEVLDAATIRLDSAPTQTGNELSFRVKDNGVFSNMNCAANAYNLDADTFRNPYFKVKYTTSESFNPDGEYVTYLSVVLALFNPSAANVSLHAAFSHSDQLTQQGSFKIRTNNDVQISPVADVTIGCREYAFIEAVYYINCAVSGGSFEIEVYQNISNQLTKLGNTYTLTNVKGTECPGTLTGNTVVARILQSKNAIYPASITIPANITSVTLYGEAPSWLVFSPNYETHSISLSTSYAPTDNAGKRYNLYFRSYGGDVSGVISQLVIDYVAAPEILSPLGAKYDGSNPLVISKDVEYTEESPLLQVLATNMVKLSSDFPGDDAAYVYSATGLLEGLSISSSTGKITGQLPINVNKGSLTTFTITVRNPSGYAANPQTLSLFIANDGVPELSFSAITPGGQYITDNISTYTASAPLVALTATNFPIYEYVLSGNLPTGLTFDKARGKVIGRVSLASKITTDFNVYAVNYYGQSNSLAFTIKCEDIYTKPAFTVPRAGNEYLLNILDEYVKISPVFTVQASQATGEVANYPDCDTVSYRNKYTAIGLPPGFTLDACTGEIYGKITSSTVPADAFNGAAYYKKYPTKITASNPVGSTSIDVEFIAYSAGAPIINNISTGRVITALRKTTYTVASPLFKINAINDPTSFAAEGLPNWLSCTTTGEIVGELTDDIPAGDYAVTLTANNAIGTSEVIACTFKVPISLYLIAPPANNTYSTYLNNAYVPLLSVGVSEIIGEDIVSITTTSSLPSGLVLHNSSISGTIASNTRIGDYPVRILATTLNFGNSFIDLLIKVHVAGYSVYGRVTDNTGSGVSGVQISDGAGNYESSTEDGAFGLTDLVSGSYNISATKTGYIFIPRYIPVNILASDKFDVNFAADGPLRLITGTIALTDGSPLKGVTVAAGNYTTLSSSFGTYELYISPDKAATITPALDNYAFTPASINIAPNAAPIGSVSFTAYAAKQSEAPIITSSESSNTQLVIYFTPPIDNGGTEITDYQYSIDAGTIWQTRSSASVTSPLTITGLSNVITYKVKLRALTVAGTGKASNTWYGMPKDVLQAPSITAVNTSNSQLQIVFTPPVIPNGSSSITNYEYSINGGDNWIARSPARLDSPITINNLTNGEYYSLALRATNNGGVGLSTPIVNAVPISTPAAPTITNIVPADSALSVYFSPPLDNGGASVSNYRYSLDNGETFTVLDPPDVLSPLEIMGLVNGTSYNVSLQAINSGGGNGKLSNIYAATPATLASAPTGLEVVPGDQQISIYVTSVVTGGSSVLYYEYSIDSIDHLIYQKASTSSSPIIITQLTNGTLYDIAIRAVTGVGAGESSQNIEARPAPTPERPGAPTGLIVSAVDDGLLSADFYPPANTGGVDILNYEYSTDNGITWTTPSPKLPEPPLRISGLTKGLAYYVKVRAVNFVGYGTASVSVKATPLGTPYAPTGIVITPGNASLSTAFKAAANGGAVVTAYEYSIDSPAHTTFVAANKTTSPIVLSALSNGTNYGLVLRAVNSYGKGAPSTEVFSIPRTTPGAPTNLAAISGDSALTVSFTAPYNGGVPISNYTYSLNGGAYVSSGRAISPITITGLNNGTAYTIALKAVNAAGTGVSASSTVIGTPYSTPKPPTITSVTSPEGGYLTVHFTENNDTGGAAIIAYKYSVDGADFVAAGTATSPILIGGLTNAVPHTVRLKAVNQSNLESLPSAQATGTAVATVCNAPTALTLTPGDHQLVVQLTPPTSTGNEQIISYAYSLVGGIFDGSEFIPTATNSPNFIISGLANNTVYTVSIYAINIAGAGIAVTGTATTPPVVPAAPSPVVLATANDNSLHFSLTAGSNGGSTITHYKYELLDETNGVVTTSTDIAATSLTFGFYYIVSLTAGHTYKIRAFAKNSAGYSEASNYSASALYYASPSTPTNVSLTRVDDRLLAVTFNPTDDGGQPITSYSFKLRSRTVYGDREQPFELSYIARPGLRQEYLIGQSYTATLLSPNIEAMYGYTISVAAKNSVGYGGYSEFSSSVGNGGYSEYSSVGVVPYAKPLTPEFYSCEGGLKSIVVGLYYKPAQGLVESAFYTLDGSAPIALPQHHGSLTITEDESGNPLSTTKTYSIQVTWTNAAGSSSSAVGYAAPYDVPSIVRGVHVKTVPDHDAGGTGLQIGWTAPSTTNNLPLTSYRYVISSATSTILTGTITPSDEHDLTFYGLYHYLDIPAAAQLFAASGLPLRTIMYASNAAGESIVSSPSSGAIGEGPYSPAIPVTTYANPVISNTSTLTRGSNSFIVNMVANAKNGGPLTYRYVSFSQAVLNDDWSNLDDYIHNWEAFDVSTAKGGTVYRKATQDTFTDYTLTVVALNVDRTVYATYSFPATRFACPPEAPVITNVYGTGKAGELLVEYQQGGDNNAESLGTVNQFYHEFELRTWPSPGVLKATGTRSTIPADPFGSAAPTFMFTNAVDGVNYYVTAKAVSIIGNSATVESSSPVVSFRPPTINSYRFELGDVAWAPTTQTLTGTTSLSYTATHGPDLSLFYAYSERSVDNIVSYSSLQPGTLTEYISKSVGYVAKASLWLVNTATGIKTTKTSASLKFCGPPSLPYLYTMYNTSYPSYNAYNSYVCVFKNSVELAALNVIHYYFTYYVTGVKTVPQTVEINYATRSFTVGKFHWLSGYITIWGEGPAGKSETLLYRLPGYYDTITNAPTTFQATTTLNSPMVVLLTSGMSVIPGTAIRGVGVGDGKYVATGSALTGTITLTSPATATAVATSLIQDPSSVLADAYIL